MRTNEVSNYSNRFGVNKTLRMINANK